MILKLIFFTLIIGTQSLFGINYDFKADSLRGSLGDIITFGWNIEHDQASELSIGKISLDGTGIELLGQKQSETASGTNLELQTAVYDSIGIYQFPPLVVYLKGANAIDSLLLPGPDLEIYSILTISDTTFRDIKGLHRIKLPFNLVILIWLCAFGVVVYLIYYLIKRYSKRSREVIDTKIIIPPEQAHIIALRDLDKLKRSKYLSFEQYKEFHSELTRILRQYFENRYLIDALELTTSEFMLKMELIVEFNEYALMTREILETADLIKFAKRSSNKLKSGEALNSAFIIIYRTKLKEDLEITN